MSKDNPFYYNLPSHPDDFVGRWQLVEEIVADLSKPRAESWAVIGGRRFGKSSVLKAVESRLLKQLAICGQGDRHVFPVIVDLKGSERGTEQNVYARIIRMLYRALRRNGVLAIDLARTDLDEVGSSETLSFYQLENALENLADYFERHCGPLRLALLLDEVEFTTRFPWSETMFNQLRALIYGGQLANTVKLVLTGSARVINARYAGSPLLNAVKIAHLGSFSDADLQELIARSGEMPDEASMAMRAQSGGHPFIAQYLLHYLWDDGLTGTTPQQVDQIARRMRQQRAADLRGWWEAVGDSGQSAYSVLAVRRDWMDERTLLGRIRDTTQPLDQGLAALCYHGLAVRDESWQRYRVVSVLFRDWFMQNIQLPQDAFIRAVPGDHESIERLRRIEEKLDRGHAADHRIAEQILGALSQNQVTQGDAAQAVAELRAWTQSVQQSGLALSPESREALDALSEHTGSDYQYLQLALSIIPGILSYNVELGSQHQLDLRAIWGRIRTRLGKKGDSVISKPARPILNTDKSWAALIGANEYEEKKNYVQLRGEAKPGGDQSHDYDVFISYSHKDREWVQGWLLTRLEEAGLKVCIDFRDFAIGVPSLINMERAVQDSRRTLLILTPDWLASEWANFEALLLQTGDPTGLQQSLLPLMLKQCKPPGRLGIFTYADFRERENWETELARLLAQIEAPRSPPPTS